jgi:GNAT superfamily N-acetyltransferase
MRVAEGITVRAAAPTDAPAIRTVAVAAWWAAYRGRLADDTIARFLAQAYSAERIAVRIDRHEVLVAGISGTVDAFAELAERDDHIQLVAIYTLPSSRGRGLGSALLAGVVAAHPGDDVAADVLLDNELAEPFYAARGFMPGEPFIDEIAGDPVRERRWWLRGGSGVGGDRP